MIAMWPIYTYLFLIGAWRTFVSFGDVSKVSNQHLQNTASGLSYSSEIIFDSFAVLCISLIIVIFVMGLATFFLIQFLYPGSAMRYLLCRRGSLDGTCSFKYVPYRDITQVWKFLTKTNGFHSPYARVNSFDGISKRKVC